MDLTVAWVKAPTEAGGLDHLGTQAPCAQIYSQLLPGITNVTNRARHYSLYPWLVWSLDNRGLADDEAAFVSNFRKAECLLTLIAERHSRATDYDNNKHGAAMAGRDKLLPALTALEGGEELRLSTYATREEVPTRYFKNGLGGLGQYYLGPFQELQLLDGASKRGWVLCSKEKALPLAQAVDARVDGDLFFRTLTADRVSLKRLDELDAFCPCRLRDPCKEHELLVDLFFDRRKDDPISGPPRKQSLLLLLHWISTNGHLAAEYPGVPAFRRSLYALDDAGKSVHWSPPESLRKTASGWRTYERNDLLSIAAQAMFFCALRRLDMEGARPANALEFNRWFVRDAATLAASKRLGKRSWGEARDAFLAAAPSREAWDDEQHEVNLREAIFAHFREDSGSSEAAELYVAGARLLMLVATRDDVSVDPYTDVPLPPNYDIDYPITLRSLRRVAAESLPGMTVPEALGWIVTEWGLKTHLLVALRKLRYTSKSTFRILPTDFGLERQAGEIVPAPTMPRLYQALQITEDLGLVRLDAGVGLTLTAEGQRVLDHGLAH